MDYIQLFLKFDLEMLIRLLLAAILGLMIGIEREMKRKSLGLKTILVISIVSCLLTIVSIQSSYVFPATTFAEIRMDPLRLAAQIVSGVGFLGAGVILRRHDDSVSGLTTAAIVWGAAGIGIASGAGFYIEAVAGVALLLISVEFIPLVVKRFGTESLHLSELDLKVILNERKYIEDVIQEIAGIAHGIENIKIKDLKDGKHLIALLVIVNDTMTASQIYNDVANIKNIIRLEVDS